ncbi:hypothetical protein E4U17_000278 [Claviceps sp. LM77 group G4]|nr:hypothetical protein E4U17_000278 [Claviceps sp. LM77 group G4]
MQSVWGTLNARLGSFLEENTTVVSAAMPHPQAIGIDTGIGIAARTGQRRLQTHHQHCPLLALSFPILRRQDAQFLRQQGIARDDAIAFYKHIRQSDVPRSGGCLYAMGLPPHPQIVIAQQFDYQW